MTLVETLVVRGEPDLVDAHLAFQLRAGVDLVLAAGGASEGTADVLERYAGEGRLRLVSETGPADELRSRLTQLAATEHGADWVLDGEADEFWWPRGESLTEILAAIPKRYTAVQGLVRPFLPTADGGTFFAERMTVRPRVEAGEDSPSGSLKAVQRAGAGGPVPLRGWYPIEILTFPDRSPQPVEEHERERGLADGSLVVDTRLRDALHTLHEGGELEFPIPDVVDDAAYAIECAAVGEVDLEQLERRMDELEAKLARLERTFWARVGGRVSRMARAPRGGRRA